MSRLVWSVCWLAASTVSLACTQRGQVLRERERLLADATASVSPTQPGTSAITMGQDHGCALMSGLAYCWGDNTSGQLGNNSQAPSPAPVLVQTSEHWSAISAGNHHTCALSETGEVWCWGGNDRGQLGQADRTDRALPALVPLPKRAQALDVKFWHSCVLLVDASLFCWGSNNEGEMGQGDDFPGNGSTAADALDPLQVGTDSYRGIGLGDGHTCAIALNGALFCWGRNDSVELGVTTGSIQIRTPTPAETSESWLSVSGGQNSTCGISEAGTLWCWGENVGSSTDDGYPLGLSGVDQANIPTQVGNDDTWTAITTDTFHSCALNRATELWCWGRNLEGQLGLGDNVSRPEPTLVGSGFQHVDAGRFATCATTGSGVVCSGKNNTGQLGLGNTSDRNVFAETLP